MAANKITISHGLSFSSSTDRVSLSLTGSDTFDQIGNNYVLTTQNLTAGAWTAIYIDGITTLGALFVKNLDATNYIQLATANDNSGIFGRLNAGKSGLVAIETGATYYVRANTGNLTIAILAIEL